MIQICSLQFSFLYTFTYHTQTNLIRKYRRVFMLPSKKNKWAFNTKVLNRKLLMWLSLGREIRYLALALFRLIILKESFYWSNRNICSYIINNVSYKKFLPSYTCIWVVGCFSSWPNLLSLIFNSPKTISDMKHQVNHEKGEL